MATNSKAAGIPARAGVGLKSQHYRSIIETGPDMGFFEVHAMSMAETKCASRRRKSVPVWLIKKGGDALGE